MKLTSNTMIYDTSILNHNLPIIVTHFHLKFYVTVFFSHIFSTQLLRKVCIANRNIRLKIIQSCVPFYSILVISAVGINVPSVFCCSTNRDPDWPARYPQTECKQRFPFDREVLTQKQNANNKRGDRENWRINKCSQILVWLSYEHKQKCSARHNYKGVL